MQAHICQVFFSFKKSLLLHTDCEEFWVVLVLTHQESDMKQGHFIPQVYT